MSDAKEFEEVIGTGIQELVVYRTLDQQLNYRAQMVYTKNLPSDAIDIGLVDIRNTFVPEGTREFCNQLYYDKWFLLHGH